MCVCVCVCLKICILKSKFYFLSIFQNKVYTNPKLTILSKATYNVYKYAKYFECMCLTRAGLGKYFILPEVYPVYCKTSTFIF